MRILKFAHLDYLKTSRMNNMLLLFPILAAVVLLASADGSALFAVGYCLFAGIVLAAFPYNLTSESERGFLQMLPARPGEAVLGHFLYGLCMVLVSFAVGMLAVVICHLVRPALTILRVDGTDVSGLYLALIGVALLFTGLQSLLMTALRLENIHLAQIIRIVPAFVFFFGFNKGLDMTEAMPDFGIGPGLAALGACLGIYGLLALISRAITIRRGE